MIDKSDSPRSLLSELQRPARAGETTELLLPLVEFLFAMLGLNERFKAGAKLAGAIATRIAGVYDEVGVRMSSPQYRKAHCRRTLNYRCCLRPRNSTYDRSSINCLFVPSNCSLARCASFWSAIRCWISVGDCVGVRLRWSLHPPSGPPEPPGFRLF